MATYQVKKGDTLSSIAKQYGVSLSDITGYRSGNPNLIYEGESLSIGAPKAQNTAQERASAIGGAFGDTSSTTGSTEAPTRAFQADSVYDVAGYKTKASEASTKKQELFGKIQNFETSRYNELYETGKLGEVKSKIEEKDNEIAEAKRVLNESLAKVRSNPGASAATITGEVGVIQDKLGNQINNLIAERNSLADSYNSGIAEIRDRIGSELKDLEREYNFYSQQEEEANTYLRAYQEAILEELRKEDERAYQSSTGDTDFARQLELIRAKESASAGSGSGGGISSSAMEWANLINEGRATIANVPANMRSSVAVALGQLEPGMSEQAQIGANYRQQSMQKVIDFVDEAKQQVGFMTSGLIGSFLKGVPGSGAKDLASTLTTIKANIGFEALQAMREASKTGGALGQVAVQELEALQSVLGSLDQTQSASQLRSNLDKIANHYRNAINALNQSTGGSTSSGGSNATDLRSKYNY